MKCSAFVIKHKQTKDIWYIFGNKEGAKWYYDYRLKNKKQFEIKGVEK